MFSDTPLPPDEPTGENPPDGVALDYYLAADAQRVSLDVLSLKGEVLRSFSSDDATEFIDPLTLQHPTYWIRPAQTLGLSKGQHRFIWDLRYAPPDGFQRNYDIAATYGNTPSDPLGPFVHPGRYRLRLTVDDRILEQFLEVRLDPRVKVRERDLKMQSRYSLQLFEANQSAFALRERIDARLPGASHAVRDSLLSLRGKGDAANPNIHYGSIYVADSDAETIVSLQEKLVYMLKVLQGADARPTQQAIASTGALLATLERLEKRYAAISE